MRPARSLAPIVAFVLVLAAVSPALAKGGNAIATLDAPLPVDPAPGTEVEIGWTLTMDMGDGSTLPFEAEGIFLRMANGAAEAIEVAARQRGTGHYVATLTVPERGLGLIEIGLRGQACPADGPCVRADEFFKIVDPSTGVALAVPAVAPPAFPLATGADPAATSAAPPAAPIEFAPPIWMALAAAVVVLGLGFFLARSRSPRLGSTRP